MSEVTEVTADYEIESEFGKFPKRQSNLAFDFVTRCDLTDCEWFMLGGNTMKGSQTNHTWFMALQFMSERDRKNRVE